MNRTNFVLNSSAIITIARPYYICTHIDIYFSTIDIHLIVGNTNIDGIIVLPHPFNLFLAGFIFLRFFCTSLLELLTIFYNRLCHFKLKFYITINIEWNLHKVWTVFTTLGNCKTRFFGGMTKWTQGFWL